MKINNIKKTDKDLTFFVSLDEKNWNEETNNALKKIALNTKSPGFRTGKVPLDVVKKNTSPLEITKETLPFVFKAIMKYLIVSKEFKENEKILLAMSPVIDAEDNKKIGPNENFKVTYMVIPSIHVGDYKKIKLSVKKEEINDKRIHEEINTYLDKDTMLIPKESGKVVKGDVVTIDFKGFVEDKPLEGGEAKNYELKIGSNSFIPGFEDQLIGMSVNDKKDINVTFPKDYQKKEIANKKAKFEIVLHSISTPQVPTLTDEFVKNLKIEKVDNVSSFKKYLKETLEKQNEEKFKNDSYKDIIDQILKISKLSYEPTEFFNVKANELIENTKNELKGYGISDINQYLQMMGMDYKKFHEQQFQSIKDRLIITLASKEIAKKEKIVVSEKEKKELIDDYAKRNNMSSEEFLKHINLEQIDDQITFDKVIDLFIKK